MASRRVRIKGIANIPQRKRPTSELQNEETNNIQTNEHLVAQPVITNLTTCESTNGVDETPNDRTKLKDTELPVTCQPTQDDRAFSVSNITSDVAKKSTHMPAQINTTSVSNEIFQQPVEIKILPTSEENIDPIVTDIKNKNVSPKKSAIDSNEIKKPPVRRRFIKPMVSHNAIARKNKQTDELKECRKNTEDINFNQIRTTRIIKPPPVEIIEDIKINKINEVKTINVVQPKHIAENEQIISNRVGGQKEDININLNETTLPTCNGSVASDESRIKVQDVIKLPKPQYIDGTKSGSDTEYPPPAASPNKFVNRPRIKAVPRLGQRRTSFSIGSASESEDDTRKSYSRIRNDSVCSAVSGTGEPPVAECLSPMKKEYSSVIQRKCRRTEQSRKLAEARRDFHLKFGSNKPDKQRLTMIDLIFYNPTTAPMSQKKKRNDTITDTESIKDPDDPEEKEAVKEASDEENTVPAPQIVIGANGEIVIDEKSLVIENKETVKGREALKQSQLVNGDFDTGYGIYKKVKRSKDWSKDETLRFYKALNTIGTDFTMMCELFPGRNRREVKMKFKKEERMNKNLVDRAVMQPVQFDMTELRREVEVAEIERQEAERLKKEKEQMVQDKGKRKRISSESTTHLPEKPIIKRPPRKKVKKLGTRQEIIKNGINSIIDSDSDSSESVAHSVKTASLSNSDDEQMEENVNKKIQTTRSGRISRPRKLSIVEDNDETKKLTIDNEQVTKEQTPQKEDEPKGLAVEKKQDSTELVVEKGQELNKLILVKRQEINELVIPDVQESNQLIPVDEQDNNELMIVVDEQEISELIVTDKQKSSNSVIVADKQEHDVIIADDRETSHLGFENEQETDNVGADSNDKLLIANVQGSDGSIVPADQELIDMIIADEKETSDDLIVVDELIVSGHEEHEMIVAENQNTNELIVADDQEIEDELIVVDELIVNEEEKNKKLILADKQETNDIVEDKQVDEETDVDEDSTELNEELVPGSLMILTETGGDGKVNYKIYTVDENRKKVPIDLSPEILENLTQNLPDLNDSTNSTSPPTENKSGDEDESIDQILPSENTIANMTVSNLPSFSDLNCSDIIIDDDSMIIPFDEFDSNLLNESAVPQAAEHTSVTV